MNSCPSWVRILWNGPKSSFSNSVTAFSETGQMNLPGGLDTMQKIFKMFLQLPDKRTNAFKDIVVESWVARITADHGQDACQFTNNNVDIGSESLTAGNNYSHDSCKCFSVRLLSRLWKNHTTYLAWDSHSPKAFLASDQPQWVWIIATTVSRRKARYLQRWS